MRTAASIHRRERLPSYGGFARSTRTSARGSSCRAASAWACGALRSPLCRRHSARPLAEIDPPVLDALRLGVYQLLWMGSVPDHAAVDETVELAKSAGGSGYRFANAVMRRAGREGRTLLDGLGDATPSEAAIRHSHPEWVVAMWWDTLGRDETIALL